MIKYPNGKVATSPALKIRKARNVSNANRGMGLEESINLSNQYYKDKNLCLIYKRPTPINVVKVDYSKGALITNAYFEKQSTTDYNGVYKGRYIDFEAKSTRLKTSIPLSNISSHQIAHLKKVLEHGGIAFFIIEFTSLKEVYLIDASYIIAFFEHHERQSIPYQSIKENGHIIEAKFNPRLDYLPIIDKLYFKN